MSPYNCNCDASAGAPRHSPGCPENDLARPAAKICDGDQGLLPCICKIENPCTCEASGSAEAVGSPQQGVEFGTGFDIASYGTSHHGVNVRNVGDRHGVPALKDIVVCGGTIYPGSPPGGASIQIPLCGREGCPNCAPRAGVTELQTAPVRKLAERIAIAVAGDEQLGGGCDLSAGMFGTRLAALVVEPAAQEAELYAAQDQVAGLQELMRTQRAPENLDVAVRHLVAAAEADDCHQGSPEHGHRLAGRWDGDNKHPKGSLCEECAAWDILRKYVATDVAAEAQVIEDARVTQLLATLKRADGIISMLMPGAAKVFNLDIMELNEGMMEIAQALANEKGSAQ